jgi:tRNA(Ile)-lysidine synthase TilS/MesJ
MTYPKAMEKEIYNFWFNNPSYWIPITQKDKDKVDAEIYNRFYGLDVQSNIDVQPNIDIQCNKLDVQCNKLDVHNYKESIGIIIFHDQFSRHFQRYILNNTLHRSIDDETIHIKRLEVINDIALKIISNPNIFTILQEEELLFILMPFKHVKDYKYVLDTVMRYVTKPLHSYTHLSKFFNDTYKKYYTLDKIKEGIKLSCSCSYPDATEVIGSEYTLADLNPSTNTVTTTEIKLTKLLENTLGNKRMVLVSLSGGIDSNVTLYLLKKMVRNKNSNIKLVALHLIYGNRKESMDEFYFIQQYCKMLDVELYYYKIEYLKRGEIEREFYEEMTRIIRFSLYKLVPSLYKHKPSLYNCNDVNEGGNDVNEGGNDANKGAISTVGVYLGHIKDDVIENIWTNIAKNQNIYNLQKMEIESVIDSVNIVRPFLQVSKEDIYEMSLTYKIPYLKNTTPEWSNRGKFRNRFYKETHEQFGCNVDDRLIELSNTLHKTGTMIYNLVYKPVINSFNPCTSSINITRAIEAELDITGWQYIFEHICHHCLHITKPSIHSIKQFIERIQKFKDKRIKIQMKMNLQVEMDAEHVLFFIYKN